MGNSKATDTVTASRLKSLYYKMVPLGSLYHRKALTSGLGLDALSLAWPAVVQLVGFFNSGSQWVY